MKPLLLEELVRAEGLWRSAIRYTDPLFQDMPVETVDPDPFNRRHWMFATDNNKVMAHVYKPDYVLKKFEEVVAPMFERAYGFSVIRADKKHLH